MIKGRGAQSNPDNKFHEQHLAYDHQEGLDEAWYVEGGTSYFAEYPKKIINKVDSPDIGKAFSMNPYQGCEHGCIYCYARNSHEYWGYSAGLDFEKKIIVKPQAAQLLSEAFQKPSWKPAPIMLSGNTDCYQPIERKLQITRQVLEVLLAHRNPVGIITKNSLILRDLDILQELNRMDLVHVNVSITSLEETLRAKLEPRTATSQRRLQTVKELSEAGIPVNVMVAPVIPGLNDHEIPKIVQAVANAGACSAAYTMVRLNGAIGGIFTEWIKNTFPAKADKVLNQIAACHGGKLNDSRFGTRMRGEGPIARMIHDMFQSAVSKHLSGRTVRPYNLTHFRRKRPGQGQLGLFDE